MLFYRKYLLDSGYKPKEKESIKVEAIAARSSAILPLIRVHKFVICHNGKIDK
jgi:hypothetical protein